ncbi:lasso peptide biosynthesis B2 protein [Sphingomonas psychrotolerans]|uniref:lasso peptide biosynthesis B2 protein n=1 Tax=Sphingomonas psychrotolerans TaxID=1327635 RepID=UPI0013051CAD|nr:lasso peptide biosynthesis B2 protein [Sphingomonas psychrotolerans]
MKQGLANARALTWRQWRLLAEASLLLAAAAAAIAFLPFARIGRLAGGRARRTVARTPEVGELRELRWAIEAMARRVPFRSKCFECGLTAQWMLRRRGFAPTLFYGAAMREGGGLEAHVWVRAGGRDVIGCENAADFAAVARFPPEPANR